MSRKTSLFDRAFDKAARLQPGQPSNLTEAEEQALRAASRAYDQRKQAAFERFRQYLKKKGTDLPYLEAKLLFKRLWAEGRIS